MKVLKVPSLIGGALLWSATLMPSPANAQSTDFAGAVVDYTPGTGISTAYTDPTSALGKPGGSPGGSGTLNPFVPNYTGSELTGIGVGGQLTLALANFVTVGPAGTREVGFFGNVGIVAASNNPPTAGNPAAVFGLRSVLISVSADGVHFVSLNGGTLLPSTLPTNYYTNPDTSNYNAAPPANPTLADFGKPFTGSLADFNGETYAQTLATLNGSAGGTWLDLSGTGLAQVGYIRFSEPTSGGQNGGVFYLNGVSGNTALLGLAVPEPSAAPWCLAAGIILLWVGRRRAARTAVVVLLAVAALSGGAGCASAQMFDFSNVQNWTGTGSNEAAMVIDWQDGKQPKSLAWGYRWDGTATGLQMIQAIDAADLRLQFFFAYGGEFIYSIGYDLNNNGGTFTPGTPGDETGSASDPDDHYAEGVFSKFWGYEITTGSPYGGGGTWSDSPAGANDRQLVNGSWDGWSLSYDEQNFSIPLPGLPTAAAPVPEPSALWTIGLALATGTVCGLRRRSNTRQV